MNILRSATPSGIERHWHVKDIQKLHGCWEPRPSCAYARHDCQVTAQKRMQSAQRHASTSSVTAARPSLALLLQQADDSVIPMRHALHEALASHVREVKLPPEAAALERRVHQRLENRLALPAPPQRQLNLLAAALHGSHLHRQPHTSAANPRTCMHTGRTTRPPVPCRGSFAPGRHERGANVIADVSSNHMHAWMHEKTRTYIHTCMHTYMHSQHVPVST